MLDAHGAVEVSRVTVFTDTPGFTAEIRATNILGGPTQAVSEKRVAGTRTAFDIDESAPKRYWVVWLTKLPRGKHSAHVNEVRAFGKS
jgi:hypothetical protein